MANGKWQMTQPFRCKMAKWPSLPMQHGKCQAFRWKMENGQASRCKWQMTGPFDGKRHDRALGRLVTGDRPRSSSLFHFPFSISSMFTAIYIPDFALQCVLRREPELRDRALAIVDGSLPARVRQMTAAARVRGVTAGMTTTQALGRCPALLAAHAARPVLVVEKARDFLAPLPLESLAADPDAQAATPAAAERRLEREETFRILRRWGIRTLGAFAALPRDQVTARLGGPAAELWDRASGRAVRPLRLVRAPEIFAEAMELEHEVETLEPLLFILRRFLEQLAARLAAAYRVAASLQLRLRFAAGALHEREFRIPAPTCDVDALFRILQTHLENVTAEAPIVAVELSAQSARPDRKQFDLFESGLRDPNKFFETLARLHALLGNDRVGTPVAEDTHRPDAFHLETPRFDEPPANAVAEP